MEIQELFQRGKREERPSFVALWKPRDIGRLVGFAVSRRAGGAVARNRARRRLREAYRRERQVLVAGVVAMFVARPGALTRRFADLREEMRLALQTFNRASAREESCP